MEPLSQAFSCEPELFWHAQKNKNKVESEEET